MITNPPLSDWSELIPDLLLLVYERLSIADFARAITVCSSWYSLSRSTTKNNVPWLIFKQDMDWKLFNPEESKFYITHISRLGLADCSSLASCGRWVLVIDDEMENLNIFNPFTSEIIHLPPLETTTSVYKISYNCLIYFDYGPGPRRSVQARQAVLWVDEITKDYLLVCQSYGCNRNVLYFCMKGDEEWIETPKCEYLGEDWCVDMAYNYKDKKLYILSDNGSITILDFSQHFPREVHNHPYVNRPFEVNHGYSMKTMKLTMSGDVVLMFKYYPSRFKVYKMNSTNEEWEIVNSMEEEEALVWDLSHTLPTKGVSGFKKDSVHFCDYYYDSDLETHFERPRTYDIPTHMIKRFGDVDLHRAKDVRWLLPCFGKGLVNRDKVDTIHGPLQVPPLKGAWTKKLTFATSSL